MTREEAATILYKEWQRFLENNLDYAGISDAYTMAINTLKQEPCEDAISRADVKKYLSAPDANGDRVIYESDLDLLPSVTPSYNSIKTELKSCDDCISRQAVINAIANTCFWLSADNWEELTKCINSISPTTPQPKIGHWILSDGYWRCSNCKGKALLKFDNFGIRTPEYIHVESNYCPNCGAKMESEDKE